MAEPLAPAVTGDETINDIKVNYSEETSKTFTSWLNRDHKILKNVLATGVSGGASSGTGRLEEYEPWQADYLSGRAQAGIGVELIIQAGTFLFDGKAVDVELPITYDMPDDVPGGSFAYLALDEEGVPQAGHVAPDGGGKPTAVPEGAINLGLVKTASGDVTGIDYTFAQEVLTPSAVAFLLRSVQAQIDGIDTGGGGGSAGGANLLPWDSTLPAGIKTDAQVLALIDGLRVELKDYVDNGRTKPMQTDTDHFVLTLMAIYASVARLAPEVTDLVDAAMVLPGFAGHSLSGEFADPGVNGTVNRLRYTTLDIHVPSRTIGPGT